MWARGAMRVERVGTVQVSSHRMNSVSVIVVGDIPDVDWSLSALGLDDSAEVEVETAATSDAALESIAITNHDLCFVGGNVETARSLLTDLAQAGLKTRVVPVLTGRNVGDRRALRASGAMTVVDADDHFPFIVPHLVAGAIERKAEALRYRDEREGLIRQLLDLRDEQERIDEQSAQLVEMAEDLQISKETLERLNSEKNRLFSIVAHDLRSPFNSILGYAELLAATADQLSPDQVKQYAEATHLAASNVFKLMQTLLEWARLQMDHVDFEPREASLADLTEDTMKVYENIAHRKGITLDFDVEKTAAFCDPGMIETVIRNLVNNAVKFTRTGGTVRLRAKRENGAISVAIQDDGVGMTEEQIAKCFSMSGNVKTTGTSGETGTGLGLLMCKDLVEKNGGRIQVESAVGSGTTFTFTIPAATTPTAG